MMATLATVALTFGAIVVLLNLYRGTLGAWLKAKFLHIGTASTVSTAAPAGQLA